MIQNEPQLEVEETPAEAAADSGVPVKEEAGDLEKQVIEALKQVDDPELGINIVDLGLVYNVAIEGDAVHVTYTLTTMGCPIGPLIETQIKQMIEPIDGIDRVEAEMVLTPPWTPDKMSEEAKAALGMF
jgi:metal-sulfur cluster biosynthetic enzyme